MTVQHVGKLSIENTGYQGRITSVSSKSKEELVSFVFETLTKLDPNETLQLTIAMKPERYEASFVTPVTIG
jgi:hypothetical protein